MAKALPRTRPDVPRPRTNAIAILSRVSKEYALGPARVLAVRDVSLAITRGEFYVFLGPSGSGKTTLLNLVGGIEAPTRGRVWVDGANLESLPPAALTRFRRDKIGFVFQFFNLIPTLTAAENVELAARLVTDALPVAEVLERVGLARRMDHFPGQLSGGEQQRVAIARAVVRRPPVLLCDEPTGELDAETSRRILALLRQLNRNQGITVLLVTHNTAIARMADHVVWMRDGAVARLETNPSPLEADAVRW